MEDILSGSRPVTALGAMSGTSLDGVDAAVVQTDGHEISAFGQTGYRTYDETERAILARALGHWEGPEVAAAAQVVEAAHLEVLGGFAGIDLVGFHGQTLAHAPRTRGTLQVGDGAHLAEALHLPVVWDFRTADVAAGGEGAPLAPFFHFACAKYIEAGAPLAFLNLGGVGNLTYVDPGFDRPEQPGALLAFDTGPANAPINDLMQARCGLPCDEEGALAAQGRVDGSAVAAFLSAPFFTNPPPKSLDRNDFAQVSNRVAALKDADAAATLTAMCAAAVREALRHCPRQPERLLVTGGGRLNPVLMRMIAESAGLPVSPVEAVGLDGDMLEAQAFAYLAVRVARGLPTSCPGTTGVPAPVVGGKLSLPGSRSRAAQG